MSYCWPYTHFLLVHKSKSRVLKSGLSERNQFTIFSLSAPLQLNGSWPDSTYREARESPLAVSESTVILQVGPFAFTTYTDCGAIDSAQSYLVNDGQTHYNKTCIQL